MAKTESQVSLAEALEVIKNKLSGGHQDFIDMTLDELKLHNDKNADYAKGGKDPLGNFHRVSQMKQIWPNMDWSTPVGTALDYAFKQMDAGINMIAEGYEGEVENVDTRFRDVHVYFKLARILWKETKKIGYPNIVRDIMSSEPAAVVATFSEKELEEA